MPASMPTSYRVFLGAPSIHDLANDPKTYSWRTTSSTSASNSKDVVVPTRTQSSRGGISAKPSMSMNKSIPRVESIQRENSTYAQIKLSQSFVLPKATLDEASRRISLIYRDLVLSGGGEEDEELGGGVKEDEHEEDEDDSGALESGIFEARTNTQDPDASSEGEFIPGLDPTRSVEVSVFRGVEQTTLISWPPSNSRIRDADETRDSNNNNNSFAAPSFLLDNTTEQSRSRIGAGDASNLNGNNPNRTSQFTGTQSQTQGLESQSFGAYSDASSIGRFPSFHFSLHALMPLAMLVNVHSNQNQNHPNVPKQNAGAAGWHGPGGPAHGQRKPAGPARKVNLLLAVLEVDGPDTIRLKKGADAGTQVSVLKLILGDEVGNVARLTAWRETAEEWGGMNGNAGVEVKRGDIVHIENVNAAYDAAPGTTMTTLSASPFLKSKLVVCYRTMPATPQDARLRPDLRLGISEPSVRRVAGIVEWFEQMAGIA
ncbi:hypothetical protein D9619_002449 [Psilocybe cf. subviscida]|uniref:Uncharacterized protein n=1 Tax=Psilocybe cf. subviscida TaxID=2480587 RepID=A0A8H5AXN3_9AGAR|nr:hypothetical protein D9619_002449 [Psilocybe cf. subviscida]